MARILKGTLYYMAMFAIMTFFFSAVLSTAYNINSIEITADNKLMFQIIGMSLGLIIGLVFLVSTTKERLRKDLEENLSEVILTTLCFAAAGWNGSMIL